MKQAANGPMSGILGVTNDEVVSTDFLGMFVCLFICLPFVYAKFERQRNIWLWYPDVELQQQESKI